MLRWLWNLLLCQAEVCSRSLDICGDVPLGPLGFCRDMGFGFILFIALFNFLAITWPSIMVVTEARVIQTFEHSSEEAIRNNSLNGMKSPL